MILTITLAFSLLVFINLLLLKFSCNKTAKKEASKKPVILAPFFDNVSENLAATGS
ncbi:hypothetical protein [Algibacter pacificus]|uniref:hypothetical protein n=1 Tax=Algibacter pacificus TaxID=2599389 RepID=UPI0016507649|nr:hypothetical protein [Algibacter pacificus]